MTSPDSNDYEPYVSTGKSIRQIVFDLMADNKDITPSQIMGILKLSYGYETANKQTIKNYMMEWRNRNYLQARPLRPHRRVFRWFVVRGEELEQKALNVGWRFASNRNRMLVFKGDYGSVHWYKTGNVFVNLRGMASLAHAKETFSRAFNNVLPDNEIVKLVDAPIREMGRQMVFDLGQPLPRFEIRHYEKSHGLRIYSDGSHPTAIEVAETEPFWLTGLEQVVTQFGKDITAHLQLVGEWRKESELRERLMKAELQRTERLEENLTKLGAVTELLQPTITELTKSVQINSKVSLTLSELIAKRRTRKTPRKPKKPTRLQQLQHGFHSVRKRIKI